jgi:chemotaxis regulatin CheY-phosphate phosphatase CheZ
MNFLYWNFVNDNKELFKKRWQGFMLKHLEKVDIDLIQEQVESFTSLPTTPYASK